MRNLLFALAVNCSKGGVAQVSDRSRERLSLDFDMRFRRLVIWDC